MLRVKAKESFTLRRFEEIKMIERANAGDKDGHIGKGDLFECEIDLAKYLLNEIPNPADRALVEVMEIIPEPKKIEEVKPKRTKSKKVAKK